MERIDTSIEVNVPVSEVYDQWIQFEDFPKIINEVKVVKRIDTRNLHWETVIAGREKSWNAEILEEVPGRVIRWQSTSGYPNHGQLFFYKIDPWRSQLELHVQYEPEGPLEKLVDRLGLVSHKVDHCLREFKKYIESPKPEIEDQWQRELL